jgi:hypothetical protein
VEKVCAARGSRVGLIKLGWWVIDLRIDIPDSRSAKTKGNQETKLI